MPLNERPFIRKGDDIAPLIGKRGADLAKNPRVVHSRPADHDAGNATLPPAGQSHGRTVDIAISNHRNLDCLNNIGDHVPIRFPRIPLLLSATMHGQSRNPLPFEDARGFRRIHRAGIPSDADFRSDWQTISSRDNRTRDAG